MATFDTKPQTELAPNYTGASQGIQSSPNTAIGTLFEGLANTLDMGVKLADQEVKQSIENEIFDNVDSIQDEFGVSSATLFQEDVGSPSTTPHALNDAGRHLSGLQAQFEQGGLRESHYWARMNTMVRQLRGRYPGYRAEIDSMVSSIVGARPANALRSSLFNEWNEASNASNSALKDYNNLVEWALKAEPSITGRTYLPMDFHQRQANGQPYSMTELQSHILSLQAEEGQIGAARTRMALDLETETFNTKKAERNFKIEATGFVTGLLGDTSNQLGRSFAEIQMQIQQAQDGAAGMQPMNAEVLQTQAAQLAQLKQGVLTALNKKFVESWDGDPNHSYAAHLAKDQYDSIVAQAMQPIMILEDAILNEDYGTIKSVSAYLKAQGDADQKALLDKLPIMSTIQALKEVAGPDALGLYLSVNPEVMGEFSTVLRDYYTSQGALGNGSITEAYAAGEDQAQGRNYYESFITGWQKRIDEAAKGNIPPQLAANEVQFMFGQEALQVMGQMTPESRYEYFRKVASPKVTQAMLSLKQQGDTDSWNTYQQWVTSSFMGLFQSAVKSMPSGQTNAVGVAVVWDPKTYGFRVVTDTNKARNRNAIDFGNPNIPPVRNPLADIETAANAKIMEGQIANLNSAIRTIAPILEANSVDVSESLMELMEQMGYDPLKSADGSYLEGIQGMLGDALKAGFNTVTGNKSGD
jgi:hypothetical protein